MSGHTLRCCHRSKILLIRQPLRSRIQAERTPSAGLTGRNIGTPFETFSRSKSMSRLCCPATSRVTASITSPSATSRRHCLERYLSAARKISRLAMGTPTRSPGGDTVTLPPDLTQEEHFDELPLGTRGGTAVRYNFPLDAKYDVQIRLARDRNEHVEGLREPHEVELMLDGERVKLFTVTPPPAGKDHSLVDKDLNVRIPVKAGPHVVAVAFPKKASPLLETERQPWQAHFNMDRHPRIKPALIRSPSMALMRQVAGRYAQPAKDPRLQGGKPDEEDACAKRILTTLMRRAYRRPVTDADVQVPFKFYKEARADGDFDAGIEMGLSAVLVSPEFLFRVEQDPAGVAPNTAYRISDLELASRLSFFLWSSIPDDELLDTAIAGQAEKPGSPRTAGSAHARRFPVASPGEQFRRAVALPAQPRIDDAGHAAVPRLRRQSSPILPQRNGAVL